jgi:elongation factor G
MFGYATELRGITQGIGEFSMEYKNHKPVATFDMDKIIQNFQKQQAARTATVKKGGSSFDI